MNKLLYFFQIRSKANFEKINSVNILLKNSTLTSHMAEISFAGSSVQSTLPALASDTIVNEALTWKFILFSLLAWHSSMATYCFASRKKLCKAFHNFFRCIKQHLKIKSFWGTTENAVRIQTYSALIAYCLVAIIGKELKINRSTHEILQVLGISLLDKTPVAELLTVID